MTATTRSRPAVLGDARPQRPPLPMPMPKIIDGATESGARAVSVEQAARLCGLGRSSTYKAVASGEIKAVRIGGRWLIPCSEIERLTAAGRAAS